MLQIIGWLGCVYLLVKGLEIVSSREHRRETGGLNGSATLAVLLAFVGSGVFFVLLGAQSMSVPPDVGASNPSATVTPVGRKPGQSFKDCLKDPTTTSC